MIAHFHRCGRWVALLVALASFASIGLVGCSGDRRGGGNILIRRDASEGEADATNTEHDTGVPISFDTGVPPNGDGGFPDGGFPDANGNDDAAEPDGGVVEPLAVSIRDLQDMSAPNHPPMDTRVVLTNVTVTAVQGTGQSAGSFWVQDTFGGPFSGILIFVPPPRVGVYSVFPGDRLTLTGTYKEYFDVTEVELDTIDAQTAGAVLAPTEILPSDIATGGSLGEAYEGVLVRVTSLEVLNDNPDAPMDFGEFLVTGGLRIDDQLYRLTPRPAIGTFLVSITGVHHHAFAEYKLLPRDPNDVVFGE